MPHHQPPKPLYSLPLLCLLLPHPSPPKRNPNPVRLLTPLHHLSRPPCCASFFCLLPSRLCHSDSVARPRTRSSCHLDIPFVKRLLHRTPDYARAGAAPGKPYSGSAKFSRNKGDIFIGLGRFFFFSILAFLEFCPSFPACAALHHKLDPTPFVLSPRLNVLWCHLLCPSASAIVSSVGKSYVLGGRIRDLVE